MSGRVGLQIDSDVLTGAMPYLDARHMLVHQDAKADPAYVRDHSHIVLKDGRIVVDFAFASAAKTAITALALHIDERIIATQLVRRQDMSGQH